MASSIVDQRRNSSILTVKIHFFLKCFIPLIIMMSERLKLTNANLQRTIVIRMYDIAFTAQSSALSSGRLHMIFANRLRPSIHEHASTRNTPRSLTIVCQARNTSSSQRLSTSKQADADGSDVAVSSRVPKTPGSASRFYAFITGFPFPLGPLFQRKTCRYEVHTGVSA